MANKLSLDTVLPILLWVIKAFYLLAGISIYAVRLTPALQKRFLAYGARSSPGQDGMHVQKAVSGKEKATVGIKILDYLATLTVPHSWFIHFYILSSICSLVALATFYFGGFDFLDTSKPNPDLQVAAFSSHLMLAQGLRRLFECVYISRSSQQTRDTAARHKQGNSVLSQMWIGHYAIGMAFYLVTNTAIWIEQLSYISTQNEGRIVGSGGFLTWKTMLCTVVFVFASARQNQYHRYLSTLEKYTLPEKHAFRSIVAPHYTMECIIYLSLAVLDSTTSASQQPYGLIPSSLNSTLLCALVFVVINLGVTANETKDWQCDKFRDRRAEIEKRWRMIPWVY